MIEVTLHKVDSKDVKRLKDKKMLDIDRAKNGKRAITISQIKTSSCLKNMIQTLMNATNKHDAIDI